MLVRAKLGATAAPNDITVPDTEPAIELLGDVLTDITICVESMAMTLGPLLLAAAKPGVCGVPSVIVVPLTVATHAVLALALAALM
jgi:hypothetical protein